MVTGASTADAAVILVDATLGVTTQTRRHSHIVALLGIEFVALAVNKLDLVGYDSTAFSAIHDEYAEIADTLGFASVSAIPVSALHGDNVIEPSDNTCWYDGPTLMEWLHGVPPRGGEAAAPLRLPVQRVNRPSAEFRGVSGQVVSGSVRVGDEIVVEPSGARSQIARIVTFDGDLEAAGPEQAVTLVFDDEIDASRGDVICGAEAPADVSDQFEAELVWLDDEPWVEDRLYELRLGTRSAGARIARPILRVDADSGERAAAGTLRTNEIATVELAVNRPVAFDPYAANRDMGGCIVIDRMTRRTVAAGMITRGLRRATNIEWQGLEVTKARQAVLNGHRARVVWLTGLSGAGKTTIANLLQQRLHVDAVHTSVLDGDNVRHGLNRDLAFDAADRAENVRRVAEVAKLMTASGLVVIVSFISPFEAEREAARRLFDPDEFVEVFVDTPLEVAEQRDPKGLYCKARAGEICGFTGVDAPYEAPTTPDIRIDTTATTAGDAAQLIFAHLRAHGLWAAA
jgi:bifunctional enzyme CysN/CysC